MLLLKSWKFEEIPQKDLQGEMRKWKEKIYFKKSQF